MFSCRATNQNSAVPPVDTSFLDNPISMTLPGQGGQSIQLIYQDGEWTLSSLESSKEIRRLQKENDRLVSENDELKR